MKVVGQGVPRVDAYGKVTGEAKYTADLLPRDYLTARVLYSTIANGLVKSIDIEEAKKVPGVVAIFTCFDVPDIQFPVAGHPWSTDPKHQDIADKKLLNRRVRIYGDDIAAVVAENEVACAQAIRLIKVEYEEYPAIPTPKKAMAEGATVLHPDIRKDNVIAHTIFKKGENFDYDEAKKAAEEKYGAENLIEIKKTYETPRISHCHIELPTSFAYVDVNGKITVTSSTQIPHICRRVISQALGVPVGKVRVIKPYIGGGFGNKQDVLYEPLNAWLSVKLGGRPVRLEIDREQTISGTRTRHSMEGEVRGLATKDGKVLARELINYVNNGGYASHGHSITAKCCGIFKNLYHDEIGAHSEGYTVYTSAPIAGAMRAYGVPQACLFAEALTDDICYAGGFDPLRFRLENCIKDGFSENGVSFYTYGLKEALKVGAEYIHWDEKRAAYAKQSGNIRRGVGCAMFIYQTAVWPIALETASCRMVLNQDGSAQVQIGATEIGQGADTVFSQMAAEASGLKFEDIYIVSMQDTDVTPFDTGAYGSRQSYATGMAVKACGKKFKENILDYAAELLECPAESLDIADGVVVDRQNGEKRITVGDVAMEAFYSLTHSQHITAELTHQCKSNTFASGCSFVDIEVDMAVGKITVKDIINVHDSGKILNPKLAEGQVHGGMSMSLGFGLSEELLIDDNGRPLNNNLLDYKIPTAMDTPDLHLKFIEMEDPTGPFGNKALGEPPAIAPATAIRNAVLNATGVAFDKLPMTPQRLIEAFRAKGLI